MAQNANWRRNAAPAAAPKQYIPRGEISVPDLRKVARKRIHRPASGVSINFDGAQKIAPGKQTEKTGVFLISFDK